MSKITMVIEDMPDGQVCVQSTVQSTADSDTNALRMWRRTTQFIDNLVKGRQNAANKPSIIIPELMRGLRIPRGAGR